jgi:hypothetical protein
MTDSPLSGLVTVAIPDSIIQAAVEFRFPLPRELFTNVKGADVHVTRMNGKALPSWLTYQPSRGVLAVNGMPDNSLPLQVLVRTGAKNWAIVINARADQ